MPTSKTELINILKVMSEMYSANEASIGYVMGMWQSNLGLDDWQIEFSLQDDLEGENETLGFCSAVPNSKTAIIFLKKENQGKETLEDVILHELIHLMMGEYDQAVDIAFEHSNTHIGMAKMVYDSGERTIQSIAQAFLRLRKTMEKAKNG